MLSGSEYGSAYKRLRQKMRTARQKAGITQAEVARIVGRPQSFVSKIETGERRVGFLEMQLLARVYGKPLSYFEDVVLARRPPRRTRKALIGRDP